MILMAFLYYDLVDHNRTITWHRATEDFREEKISEICIKYNLHVPNGFEILQKLCIYSKMQW